MKKQNYSAPKMVQVRMETEMPVMQTSYDAGGNTLSAVGNWPI